MKKVLSSIALVLILFSCKKETTKPELISPQLAKKQEPKIQIDGTDMFKGSGLQARIYKSTERIAAKTHYGSRNNDAAFLLVFNGATVTGTIWNTLTGRDVIEFPPSGLSNQMADAVFRENVQAFRDWQINITTDSAVWLQAPENRRQIVIYSADDIGFGAAIGGVAILGSMVDNWNTPALVFSQNLGYDDRNTQAGVHEAGHTVMLYHQADCENGIVTRSYSLGNSLTAPYMGISYYAKKEGSWWVGTREPDCVLQDDRAVISSYLKPR
jgi:hypothetical protein